jgi:hypothetical protein
MVVLSQSNRRNENPQMEGVRVSRLVVCHESESYPQIYSTTLTSSAKSEMLSISVSAEMMRGDLVAINISSLCGDDSVHILQGTNRKDL